MKTREPMQLIRRYGRILYDLLLLGLLLNSLMYSGFLNLSGGAMQLLINIKTPVGICVALLGLGCALAEMPRSLPRAAFAALLLILRLTGTVTWQCGMLLDTALLAALSDLGTEKNNASVWLLSHAVFLVMLLALMRVGIVSDVTTTPDKAVGFIRVGHSFGMGHPNNMAVFILSTWLMLWLLLPLRRWWITVLFFWAGAFLVFALTLCRTVAALMAVFPVLPIAFDAIGRGKHGRLLRWTALLPAAAVALTLLIGLMMRAFSQYDYTAYGFWLRFQEIALLKKDGLTLFGAATSEFAFLDNLYLWLPANCGLIPALIALALYGWMLFRLAQQKRIPLLAAAVLFLIYGIMENAVAYLAFAFPPLLAFADGFHARETERGTPASL